MTNAEVRQAVSQIISNKFYVHTTDGSIFTFYKDDPDLNLNIRNKMFGCIPVRFIRYINDDRGE
jgi:hypothetical protein